MKWMLAVGCFIALGLGSAGAAGGPMDRSGMPEELSWNLEDLYPGADAWKAEKVRVSGRFDALKAFEGRVGDSARTLYDALSTCMDIKKEVVRLNVYAFMLADQDTRVSEHAALEQEADALMTRFTAVSSFIDPEILALDPDAVKAFLQDEPRLAPYRPYLDNILRRKAHTRSPEIEEILARAGEMMETPNRVYGTFTAADFPFPLVTLAGGDTVRLDAAGYARTRGGPNREDRLKVFRSFWSAYKAFERTFGASLYGQIQAHDFARNARRYDSCLEAALDRDAIPASVYERLIEDTHAHLPTLHRYLHLRKRMMGLDILRYEDLYAPLVKDVDMRFTPEEAMDLTLEAFSPLGREYVEILRRGYQERWTDFYPSPGKRSGAYSEGAAYDVHPYQLLNFNGSYNDVSTLAHESGHSLHYFLSNRSQPYVTSEHATFVAEVASTLNENLLFYHMLARADDDAARLFLLGERLEGYRTTLFRQTLFAEFELRAHEMVEAGRPLTGEAATTLYLDLLRTYYGHDLGICTIEDLFGIEWAYIHHFYAYDFYVFQYATSLTASTAIARIIGKEAAHDPPSFKTRDAFLGLLSAGCSRYPIDLLDEVGIDMRGPVPFREAMAEMNEIMDRIEAILEAGEAG